jgi:hypothetical protein
VRPYNYSSNHNHLSQLIIGDCLRLFPFPSWTTDVFSSHYSWLNNFLAADLFFSSTNLILSRTNIPVSSLSAFCNSSGKLLSFHDLKRIVCRTIIAKVRVSVVLGMPLLIFVVAKTDVYIAVA